MSRLALLLALASVAASGCRVPEEDGGASPPEARQPAPDFTLPALDGGEVGLADLRGRPVIVDFWATWCLPCIHQIPVLNAFQEAHPEDVVVLGVSVDTEGREVVAAFAAQHDIRYRVLLGDPELAQRYGAFGFPSLYVVAPDGTIETAHVGVVSAEDLEEALERVSGP